MKIPLIKKFLLIFLLIIFLINLFIFPQIAIAENFEEIKPEEIKEYLQLPEKDAQKLIAGLNQILINKKSDLLSSENPDPRETAANEIIRKGAKIQVLNHLLIDAPIEVIGKIVKYAIDIAQIILAKNISKEFWEKFEKETVERATGYGMKALMENEIKITPGALKYSYTSYKGNKQEVILQYLIIYNPTGVKQGKVEIRFYSPVTIEPPPPFRGWFLTGTYHELEGDLQPFIVEISGSVKDYEWTGTPLVEITFPEQVPDLGIKPLSFWDKNVVNPIKESLKETNFVFQKILGKTSKVKEKIQSFGEGAISNIEDALKGIKNKIEGAWQKFEETVSQFNFWAAVGLSSNVNRKIALESSLKETEGELESLRKEISLLEEKLKNEEGLRAEQKEKYESEVSGLTGKINSLAEMVDDFNTKISELSAKEKTTQKTKEEGKKETEETEKAGGEIIICQKREGDLPKRNKIIFNEIAWMGTVNSANDEWFELKNISGTEVDLAGWQILDKDGQIKIIFSSGERFSANGFYLLERTDDNSVPNVKADKIYTGSLNDTNEALYLFNKDCQLEDEVLASPDWPAGDKTSKRTLERKSDLSWQTSSNPGGTPKSQNSSGYFSTSGGTSGGGGGSTSGGGSSGGTTSVPNYCSQENLSSPSHSPVIINEVAWMGTSTSSSNEWIELKNISANEISLTNWQLLDKDKEIKIVFIGGERVSANGFYLLERTDDNSVPNITADKIYTGNLEDSNESLRLFDQNCNLIDEVIANPDWPAGNKNEKRSMERSDDLSWHSYFGNLPDSISGLMATPKAENSVEVKPRQTSAQAILEVSPESLEFTAVEFSTVPQDGIFTITNIGSGDLNWTASIEYTSPPFDGIGWLTIDPASGTAPAGVSSQTSVSADISRLAEGIYTAKIIITAGEIEGSPKEIDVNLTVGPSPEEAPSKILITEIQISPIENRFVELYNPNNTQIDLTGYYIQRKTKTGENWQSLVSSTEFEEKIIQPKNHFLISRNLENSNILLTDLTLTENNSLVLKNPNREIADLVGWGNAQDFETAPTSNPESGKSIGRKWSTTIANYVDTNNNLVDFEIQNPTPKSKNQTIEEAGSPFEIVISEADTVWNLNLKTASSDLIDSSDASPQDLAGVFVSHADTFRNLDFIFASLDVIDSTDAPPQILPEAYVSGGDTDYHFNLEKQF